MHNNNTTQNNSSILDMLKGGPPDSFSTDYGCVREYYLSDEIGPPAEYVNWFHEIRNCRNTDTINIHINCPGGNLFTTIQFLQAMADTQARIVVSVEGACMSAATLIFLAADECMITNHSMFLFHNYSAGTAGKGGEMYHGMVHERKWSTELFESMYTGFLTDSEIIDMTNDKDIWLDANQVLERLEKRGKLMEKKAKKAGQTKKTESN